MARLVVAVVTTVTTFLVPATASAVAPDDPEVVSAAADAGKDPTDVAGASNSTGLAPRDYLVSVGDLEPPVPVLFGAIARADCIIGKESGGLDIPNRQGSGANGPGQYFPSTWARHTALYRAATGFAGSLSLHSLSDVRRVMSWILAAIPSTRAEWSVGGC